jgi:glutamyl-tRNA synthetase
MSKIVTRISPSPTANFCHIGNIRTLLYNYFLAKQNGGKFLVRLEDTDRDRYNPDFLDYFKRMCDWLGIVPDYSYWNPDPKVGSFIQSERDYSDKVKFLIDNGYAYYAFDTKDDLDRFHKSAPNVKYDAVTRLGMVNSFTLSPDQVSDRISRGDKYVVRFAVPSDTDITFTDAIRGEITINSNQLDDKVLLKSDGIASYHLANTSDDHDMGVTHVLRGQEWVASTPFHVILYRAFGWDLPTFAHLPLIMNPDGKGKLSKRTASKYGIPIAPLGYTDSDGKWVPGWKEAGFDADVFINTLSLIGWSPSGTQEILSMDDLISQFSLDRVHRSGARFDMDKAKHFNSWYLNHMRSDDYLSTLVDFGDSDFDSDTKSKILDLAKKRSVFGTDMQSVVDIFVNPNLLVSDCTNPDSVSVFERIVTDVDFTMIDSIKSGISQICLDLGIKMGKIMPDLRTALTGGVPGPDLMTVMSILSPDDVRSRISRMCKKIPA